MAGTVDWKVGFKKAATWGTAVDVGAGDQMKIISEGLGDGIPKPIQDENIGDALKGQNMQGDVELEGSIAEIARFEGLERRLALFMGSDTVAIVQAGQVWSHAMNFKPSNTGKFGTLVLDKGMGNAALWEYPSVKQSSMDFDHQDGKLVFTHGLIANKVVREATENDATSMGALTIPTNALMVIFQHVKLQIKEVTGAEGNLAGGDEILVTNVKGTCNRNIKGDHESGSNAGYIGEPETDGLPEAQLMFTVANYKSAVDALIKEQQKVQAGREPKTYKLQLTWTGKTIAGSAPALPYILRLDVPAANFSATPVPGSGPGSKVPVEMTMDIVTPQIVPNGTEWAWVVAGVDPFRWFLQNKNQTSMA
jgi:hypothetical protein